MASWYHTIELPGRGRTPGHFDHGPVLGEFGFPDSLRGQRVLDVGTADGFFAFEFERRGAAEVIAIDIARWEDTDLLPQHAAISGALEVNEHFREAHHALDSAVRFIERSIYHLCPEQDGVFDLVFCGSLLIHLLNPLAALVALRSVTAGRAIVETTHDGELEQLAPWMPAMRFGNLEAERVAGHPPGSWCHYWQMNRRGLEDLMRYAGFSQVEVSQPFTLPPVAHPVLVASAAP